MANKKIFNTVKASLPKTDTVNNEGAAAYKMTPKHALAQLAMTGCMNQTFYVSAESQLDQVLSLCNKKVVSAEFIAKLAVFARKRGYMKDMPALLCAVLAKQDVQLLKKVFPVVIDNGKMLRNFVQMVRSDKVGRKSLGHAPKRLVEWWFNSRTDEKVFWDSIGDSPSIGDVLKLSHPRPRTESRRALYGYLTGYDKIDESQLPEIVKKYEAFKKNPKGEVPNVPFLKLTSLNISTDVWKEIARNASWTTTRMNLNTFERHKVFEDDKMVQLIAARLRNPELIRKSRVFPYQLMTSFNFYSGENPAIKLALQHATDVATENIPDFGGRVALCIDISSSMSAPVTGERKGSTTKVNCVEVAGLIASSILKKNQESLVIVFNQAARVLDLNPLDSVMTNTKKISNLMTGGTACSAALQLLNQRVATHDLVIFVSDNESWADRSSFYANSPFMRVREDTPTEVMAQWRLYKKRNKKARMVCLDLAPNRTAQAKDNQDILNIGGFSDLVFTVINDFAHGRLDTGSWEGAIDQIDLNQLGKFYQGGEQQEEIVST